MKVETMSNPSVQIHDLGPLLRIPPGEGLRYRVGGDEIAVFRTRRNELYAVQAACPHAGGPLADGLVGNGRVVCPLHGRTFDLATGDPIRNECPALRTYHVSEDERGHVVITVMKPQT
jgi:nitrite reductase (NADH) small subunit